MLSSLQQYLSQILAEIVSLHYVVALMFILALLYLSTKKEHVYLVDFSCYQPPDHLRVAITTFIEHSILSGRFDESSIDFQLRTLRRSGIGNDSYLPYGIHELPPDLSLPAGKEEVEEVFFSITEDLFTKHNISPNSIDILISNCSGFAPTPSICSMLISRFKMKSSVMSFNLSGMGCSAGIISIQLGRNLLEVHKNSLALILTTETIGPYGYSGHVKSMLMCNCLFRMGAAAILLGNRKEDKKKAKYMLEHTIRTHKGHDDDSYRCVFLQEDQEGHAGHYLSKDIVKVARDALTTNISTLGPSVLPLSEKIRYGLLVVCQKILRSQRSLYIPDFKGSIHHFCIHAGGRTIVEQVEKNLGLTSEQAEPPRMTLYRFGNTSSSSIWYELAYIEAKRRIKKGERVLQLSFGSGFKCNSAVWKCVSEPDKDEKNAWSDRIHHYPVEVPTLCDY